MMETVCGFKRGSLYCESQLNCFRAIVFLFGIAIAIPAVSMD